MSEHSPNEDHSAPFIDRLAGGRQRSSPNGGGQHHSRRNPTGTPVPSVGIGRSSQLWSSLLGSKRYQTSSRVLAPSSLSRVVYRRFCSALTRPPFTNNTGAISLAGSEKLTTALSVSFHGSMDFTEAM